MHASMPRRHFLAAAGGTVGATLAAGRWATAEAQADDGPYGPLGEPDENGIRLPEGFTSTVVARSGEEIEGYTWPIFPDGAATFPDDEGGWYHAVNSEVFIAGEGGVSAIHYDADGVPVEAYPLLTGSRANCAGGPTPWGTWLSCEEFERGEDEPADAPPAGGVWECDPTTADSGALREALGRFIHEAVAVDPDGEALYMTEDHPEGGFYRFRPDAYPDLASGLLEIATVAGDGTTTWSEVPDPSAESGPCREQVADRTAFAGGEGCWFHDGVVYFTTKFDDRVWEHDVTAGTTAVLYDANELDDPPLRGVDNVTVEAGSGDVLVAEDGDDMEIILITPEGDVAPLLQISDEPLPAGEPVPSEVTGPAFNPAGDTLYFSSQRGGDPQEGITYAVTGPFRGVGQAVDDQPSTSTTIAEAAAAAGSGDDDGDDGSSAAVPIGIGVGAALAAGAGAVALRRRRQQ